MELSGAVSAALDPRARKAPPAQPGSSDPLARWFFAAALGLGALRLFGLSRWSLWLDEAFTLADVSRWWTFDNPLGYFLFSRIYGLLPETPDETWLRLPSALLGLCSIPACLWAFRPFFGGRAAALAAFFVSSSAWHLYWSQNARFYTLAQILALLGGGALLRGLYGASSRRTVGGLILLALAALAHPSAALLVGPLLVTPWLPRWLDWIPEHASEARSWRILSLTGFVCVLLGSGWALRAWLRYEVRQGEGNPLHLLKTSGYLITPTLGLAFLVGAFRGWRRRESFVPLVATLLGLLSAGLLSFLGRVSAQYVFVVLPWLAAVAGLAFLAPDPLAETRAQRRKRALLALVVALPGLVESALYFTLRHGDRPRWREAFEYVFEHRGPRDLLLGMEAPVAEYYLNPASGDARDWTAVTWLDSFRARLAADWLRYDRPIWFVVNEEQMNDWRATDREEVERILAQECRLEARFEIPLTPRDLDVLVYRTR